MTAERFVVYGSGGVGKTTTAAALAVSLAQRGRRTLVVTTDPARRLADALAIPSSTEIVAVPWAPGLDGFMPEARATTRTVAAELLVDSSDVATRLQHNPVFEMLCSGLAGVHELATLASLGPRIGGYDAVVIDTAPSRHALELVSLPRRLSSLVDSRALQWLARLSNQRLDEQRGFSARLLDWGQRQFVARFDSALGGTAVTACMEVLSAVMAARPRLSETVRITGELLTGPTTQHVVVLAPRHGALHEAAYFSDELARLAHRPSLYVVNRVASLPAWASTLAGTTGLPPELRQTVDLATAETVSASGAAAQIVRTLSRREPAATVLRVPTMAQTRPAEVVAAVAQVFAELGPRRGDAAAGSPPLARGASGASDALADRAR